MFAEHLECRALDSDCHSVVQCIAWELAQGSIAVTTLLIAEKSLVDILLGNKRSIYIIRVEYSDPSNPLDRLAHHDPHDWLACQCGSGLVMRRAPPL